MNKDKMKLIIAMKAFVNFDGGTRYHDEETGWSMTYTKARDLLKAEITRLERELSDGE